MSVAGDAQRSFAEPKAVVEAQVRPGDVQADVEMAPRARISKNVRVEASRYVVHVWHFCIYLLIESRLIVYGKF